MIVYFHIVIHHMRTLSTLLLLVAFPALGSLRAQDVTAEPQPTALMQDLCGCMSAIDLKGSDAFVQRSVRGCLEQAVVLHPMEVRTILQRRPSAGSKAFQLGTALGGALQHMCQPFNVVRDRLNRMPTANGAKQGT